MLDPVNGTQSAVDEPMKLTHSKEPGQGLWPLWPLSIAGFFLLALVSSYLPFPGLALPAVWLPSGLTLALFLRFGNVIWPLATLGSIVSVSTLGWFWQQPLDTNAFLLGGALVCVTLAEGSLAALALRRVPGYQQPLLAHFSSYLWLVGVCTSVTFSGALFIAAAVTTLGQSNLGFSNLILSRFFADFTGMLIIVPLLLVRQVIPSLRHLWRRPAEWVIWLFALVLISAVAQQQHIQVIYLVTVLMIWAATRFSLSGSMVAIALAGIVITSESLVFYGYADTGPAIAELLLAQALIVVMISTSTYVRVVLEDRRRVEANLENKIEERTRELQIRNSELSDEIFVREQAEKSFRRSNKHYRSLVETASNPIIVIDERNKIRQWNSAAEHLFGYSRDEAIGTDLLDAYVPELCRDEMAWKITKVRSSGLVNESVEAEAYGYNGSVHIMLWNINGLHEEEESSPAQLILIGQDITEIRETQNKLHFLAHYDALTGTANRRLFEDRCRQVLETATRYGHESALISLDVDHFKRINDTFGHDAGDVLLQEIAARLRDSVRKEDTISRMGGDEFAILLNRVNGLEGCEKVARTILDNVTRPIQLPSGELVITSSLGITVAPQDAQTYEELLKNADMAMYRAKNAGRNNIQFFSTDMTDEMRRQMIIEAELRHAIEAGDLHLYYQPVLDTLSGDITSLEALLRWHHPETGLLGPAAFLDVAEQSGQLLGLGEWVCYNACLQARAIQTMSGSKIPVSINLSSRQYHHPQLCATLARIMNETHVGPGMLCIEVDEKTISEQLPEAPAMLRKLHDIGVNVILDRFGSGLSSIRLLRDLPFDQIKIDGGMLRDVPKDSAATTVVQTLLSLAMKIHNNISVGGVETEQQRQLLQEQGCHKMQGFLFSHAIPNDRLADLFADIRAGKNIAGLPDTSSTPR